MNPAIDVPVGHEHISNPSRTVNKFDEGIDTQENDEHPVATLRTSSQRDGILRIWQARAVRNRSIFMNSTSSMTGGIEHFILILVADREHFVHFAVTIHIAAGRQIPRAFQFPRAKVHITLLTTQLSKRCFYQDVQEANEYVPTWK